MLTIDKLKQFGANTDEGLGRCLNNEAFYLRLVAKALDDASFDRLSAAVDAGDIVAFQSASADAVTIRLAIGAGDSRLICTTETGGWVVLSYMDQMEGATIYCWDAGDSVGE